MKKSSIKRSRNWLLVVIAVFLILMGVALATVAILHIGIFGWVASGIIAVAGVAIIAAAVTSIATNDPSWILLQLLFP